MILKFRSLTRQWIISLPLPVTVRILRGWADFIEAELYLTAFLCNKCCPKLYDRDIWWLIIGSDNKRISGLEPVFQYFYWSNDLSHAKNLWKIESSKKFIFQQKKWTNKLFFLGCTTTIINEEHYEVMIS